MEFVNFDQASSPTGIDILTDPQDPDAVYTYAANHLPSPAFPALRRRAVILEEIPRARSQPEISHHRLGSGPLLPISL